MHPLMPTINSEDRLGKLRIALLQILPTGSLEGNRIQGLAYCRHAKSMGADLALFPEMWSHGYQLPEGEEALRQEALALDSSFVQAFAQAARDLNMAIGLTFLESHKPSPRNSFCLFDRYGRMVLHYAKVHLCYFDEDERQLTPGDGFDVCDLDTKAGPVKIGAMICYDREFPESARILMLKGAEIILVPNACPMEINRISQLRARAFENMLGIVTVNYPSPYPDCNGHSNAFDGMVYLPHLPQSRDTLILEADENQGIFLADFPLEDMRAYRKCEVHGNAYRWPEKYKTLTSTLIEEPFIRPDYPGGKKKTGKGSSGGSL